MNEARLSIAELADAAGISRRAVRFYVARKLLPPPEGRGRAGHYTAAHVQQLRRIQELQRVGHPLDAIRKILDGGQIPPPPAPAQSGSGRIAGIQATLWTRIVLATGVELHVDMARHSLTAEQILALREASRAIIEGGSDALAPHIELPADEPQRRTP